MTVARRNVVGKIRVKNFSFFFINIILVMKKSLFALFIALFFFACTSDKFSPMAQKTLEVFKNRANFETEIPCTFQIWMNGKLTKTIAKCWVEKVDDGIIILGFAEAVGGEFPIVAPLSASRAFSESTEVECENSFTAELEVFGDDPKKATFNWKSWNVCFEGRSYSMNHKD